MPIFNDNSIQQGLAAQLYAAMHQEMVEAAASLNFWTTLNTWMLIASLLVAILISTTTPFLTEKRRSVKWVVVLLGIISACLAGANSLFHPAATAQAFQNIIVEATQAAAQYNEEFHNLQQGPSFARDELALRDKYAVFQTEIAGKMNSINLSFGTLDTQQAAKVPVTVPLVDVPPVTVSPPR